MADRVDKAWQKNGLTGYSTGAILGTLQHYGVSVDEGAFKKLTREKYPLQVAHDWHASWKGTGQFAKYPYAAANELFRRVWPDRLPPLEMAKALVELIGSLQAKLDGATSAPVAPAFAKVKELKARLPGDVKALEGFMDEVVVQLGEQGARAFDELAETLAEEGHLDDAREFAELEEALLPDRRGIATAVIRAAAGEKEPATKDLEAIVGDESRKDEARVMALDGLIHLDAFDSATQFAAKMLDVAEKAQNFHLGLALCERLAFLYEKQEKFPELQNLADRAQALAKAHDEAHPHHGHGHHHRHR